MRGTVLVSLAIKLLTEALRLVQPTTEEGRDILKALSGLTKRFGGASGDLTRQEVKLLADRSAPVAAPTPQQAGDFQKMVASKIGGMGIPPGAGG